MTVTIPSTGGFELEVVTQISNVQAGVLAAGTNGKVSTVGGIQFAFSTGETTSWTFSWTPPTTNVGSVVLYVTGGGHSPNYSNNFVMTPAAGNTAPSIASFVAGAATITAGTSTTLTGVFSNGTGSVSNGVGSVTSGTAVTVSPTATTTYTLTVTGGGTTVTKQATVTVAAATIPPTITSFTPGAAAITAGKSTTLTAVFSNGTGSVNNGVGSVTSGAAVSVSPTTTTTYTLTVTGSGTSVTKQTTVTVGAVTTSPTITSFTPGAATITAGTSTTLTGVFSNGTGSVSNGVGSVTSGTAVTVSPTATTTYTLTVTGGGTTVTKQTTVTVGAVTSPTITSFTPGAAAITAGKSTTLTAVFSNGTGSVDNGVGSVTSGAAVSVSPTASTTYTLTVAGGGTSVTKLTTVTVNPPTNTGALTASPLSLTFNYQVGGKSPASRTLAITSTGGSTAYTATETDPWLSISPTSGTTGTSGNIRVSVNPAGMAPGTYGAQININGTTITVPVSLIVTSGNGGGQGGGGNPGGMNAQAYVSDPQSGALAAAWVDNLGTSPHNTSDPQNRGLVLAKSASAPTDALAGATIQNVTGISLTELGFDFRAGIMCSADSPHFVVVTTDGVTHTIGGCSSSAAAGQSSTPMGWMRLRFSPSQATPPIQPTDHVQSISVVLDKGPNQPGSTATQNATGSIVVLDNININGTIVGKGSPTSTTPPPPRHRDD